MLRLTDKSGDGALLEVSVWADGRLYITTAGEVVLDIEQKRQLLEYITEGHANPGEPK